MHTEFPLDSDLIHLNHAGVAPWPRRTVEAIARFAEENMRRGSEAYREWMECETRVRSQLAQLINAPTPEDIALLHSTSEGLSVVAYGLDWKTGENVVFARQEFPSNRLVWESLHDRFGVEARAVDLFATDDPEQALIEKMDTRTRVLAVSSVQYATGLRMNLQRLGKACRERGILFCVDGIQSIGAFEFDVQSIGADFVAADAHKWMLAPEGIALFYARPEARERLRLNQFGWHMVEQQFDFEAKTWTAARSARRFEPGSPNMLGIFALHESLGLILDTGLAAVGENISRNISYLIDKSKDIGLEILSPQEAARRAGIMVFRDPETPSETLYTGLQNRHVLCALRGGGVRFSPHFYTPEAALDEALARVEALRKTQSG